MERCNAELYDSYQQDPVSLGMAVDGTFEIQQVLNVNDRTK